MDGKNEKLELGEKKEHEKMSEIHKSSSQQSFLLWPIRAGPEEGNENYQRAGTPLL